MTLIPPDMRLGAWVSGLGHGGLFLWLVIGGFFVAREDIAEFTVTDVSIISAEEFAALQPSSPETGSAPAALTQPEIEETPPTPVVQEEPEVPQPAAPTIPEAVPLPVPEPETPVIVDDSVPISPEEPEAATAPEEDPDAVPVPEEAERIAPETVETPEPDVVISEEDQAPTASTEEPVTVVEEAQEETAREAAADEIVTEAEEPNAAAPTKSLRPATRPKRPPPTQVAEPEEQPTVPGLQEAIEGAVAEANSENAQEDNANPGAGSGPPITQGEKESFILAIRQCWNVGALSSDSLRVTVIIGVDMRPDGKPDAGSIRMISSDGGSGAAVRQAFEAGRRAIIRCGTNGYELPTEKYAQWKEVQITFNPERMRIK